ncbi:putative Desumoylating isopeptidase 1, partial [Hypsibius exemplaris]
KHLDEYGTPVFVATDEEFFSVGQGYSKVPAPGTTVLGPPDSIVDLGTTCLPREIFLDWMNGMSLTTFKGSRYHLLDHNCNNFSNEMAQFLTGKSIPSYITDLPAEILATPLGPQLRMMFDQVANSVTASHVGLDPSRTFGPSSARSPSFDAEEEELMAAARAAVEAPMPRATARVRDPDDSGSDTDEVFQAVSSASGSDRKKPYVFSNIDVTEAYSQLQRGLAGVVPPEDSEILDEVFEFATTTEDNHLALSVSRNHFTFLSDILVSEELGGNLKIQAAKMLQYLVQASPAISVLRMCLEHPIMEYLLVLGKQRNPEPHELCEALKLICNACSSSSGLSWVTDEAEWADLVMDQKLSNVLVTVQFCAWCLAKPSKDVQENAAKLTFNLSSADIPDNLAVLLGEALLKLFANSSSQPQQLSDAVVEPAVAALTSFVELSTQLAQSDRIPGIDWTALQARFPKSKDQIAGLIAKLNAAKSSKRAATTTNT